MIFILYAELNRDTINSSLGLTDYSYYFVLKQFIPLLEKHGMVVEVSQVDPLVDNIYNNMVAIGESCIFLSFTPPHKTCGDLQCPTIPVFAWEYSTIPNESWGGNKKNNWAKELENYPAAITHSRKACGAVKKAVFSSYPIFSIPAPVWDGFQQYFNPQARSYFDQPLELHLTGYVIDSYDYDGAISVNNVSSSHHTIDLTGVVYSSVFAPSDGRKNWSALVQAFCWAFKHSKDATLVLKLTHIDPVLSLDLVASELNRIAPFDCRVLLIHGYLDNEEYENLIRASHFVVNSAYGEGQCLPLMEFMSAGSPAIAPDHSGMADYIRPENSFVVESHDEWVNWPEDPRVLLRTFRRRVDWGSLHDSFLSSYQEAKFHHEKYKIRSARARKDLYNHCSQQIVSRKVNEMVQACKRRRPEAYHRWRQILAGPVYTLIWRLSGWLGFRRLWKRRLTRRMGI